MVRVGLVLVFAELVTVRARVVIVLTQLMTSAGKLVTAGAMSVIPLRTSDSNPEWGAPHLWRTADLHTAACVFSLHLVIETELRAICPLESRAELYPFTFMIRSS